MEKVLNKKIFTLVTVVAMIVGGIFWLERPKEGVVCPQGESGVYSLAYADGKGTCHELSEYSAPVVVINTWASWCPFCVEEMPDLAKLAEEFPDVPVIAINRGESSSEAREFLETLALNDALVLLYDPEESFYKFIEGFGMPETIFIDNEGEQLFHKRGVMSLQEMRDTVSLLTGRTQPNTSTKNNHRCVGGGESCRI